MQIAIISDIHGNLEAFQAVTKDLDARKPDQVICLGDLIGYGPNPEEIISLVRQKKYTSILGNHEAALFNPKMRNWLNFQAKENSLETEKLLSKESLEFCAGLKENLVLENALFVHGFPPKSVLAYVTTVAEKKISSYLEDTPYPLCFVGHTHDLVAIYRDGIQLKKDSFTDTIYKLKEGCKYIISAGSVGQPRDGENSAKYLLWDTQTNHIEIARIKYDYRTTSAKIKERGFPDVYGYRLG